MIRNALTILLCLVAGAAFYRFIAPPPQPPVREETGLTTGRAQAAMRLVSLRVPATVFSARGQVVPADGIGKKIEELILGEEKKQVILFLKGQLDFGVDFESGAFKITTDPTRKIATIDAPSPRFLHISDQQDEVAFTFGPVTEADINNAKNKAVLLMRREANHPRYIAAAKSICTEQLTALATAFGYTARIVWHDPASTVPPNRDVDVQIDDPKR